MSSLADHGVDDLVTPRLILRPLRWATALAILEGRRQPDWAADYPTEGDIGIAGLLQRAGPPAAGSTPGAWCHRQVVERGGGMAIGGIGFHSPPAAGVVELGYGIVPSHQGRGYATEAVKAMVALAWSDPQVRAVTANTDLDNIASQRVLEKAGFEPKRSAISVAFSCRRPLD